MICPRCKSDSCRRSRRKNVLDYALGLTGLRPWRCRICERRFHAWSVPPQFLIYAHCSHCGNLNLQRIDAEYVNKGWPRLWRLLGAPAYRCQPCRHRFFSLLRFHPLQPARPSPPDVSKPEPDAAETPHP